MADLIVSPIVNSLVEYLTDYLKDQYELRSDVKGKLTKLKEALNRIQAVVKIADEVEMEENEHLAEWLRDIKDASYQAEDVLEEFGYRALERQVADAAADQDNGSGRDNPKKIVLKLGLHDDKAKQKAMKLVLTLPGIYSVAMDMKESKLTMIGFVDPVSIVGKLRKFGFAEILSVGLAKEPEKKKEAKKEEPKKEEAEKKDPNERP